MFVAQSLKMISQVGTKQLMALWQPSCSLLAAIASRSRNWNGGCKSSVQSRRAEEHGWAEMHQRRTIGPSSLLPLWTTFMRRLRYVSLC